MNKIKTLMKFILFLSILISAIYGIKELISLIDDTGYFSIKEVDIVCADEQLKGKLEEYSSKLKNKNIFFVNIEKVDIVDNKWIKNIEFNRLFPDKIKIVINKRKSLFKYKKGSKCYYLTDDLKKIASNCEDVNVAVKELTSDDILFKFSRFYQKIAKNKDVVAEVNPFYFKITDGQKVLYGSYDKNFFGRYKIYKENLHSMYNKIERVDLRIEDKIYIKGVLNGA